MRSRFHHDVIRLNPRVVVIQGGINDFVRVPLTSTEQSLEAMADQANENGIAVVLAKLLPTGKYDSDIAGPGQDSGHQKIRELSDWIKDFAAKRQFVVADHH
jgi:GDSL-like Lipase/Acylhydrolase family